MKILKKSIVVIPARGGSKRLPRKNLLDLGGKPLIAHTIETALEAGIFETVLVSTDDPEIANVAKGYDDVIIDDRTSELAGDFVKVVDVIEEICSRTDIRNCYDIVCMMLPTAPFRSASDLWKGATLFGRDVDAVVSFAEYEFPPSMAVSLADDCVMTPMFRDSPLISGDTRSQDQAVSLRPNGAFFISWITSFLKNKSFYKGTVKGVLMDRWSSIDIDERDDLLLANMIIDAGFLK